MANVYEEFCQINHSHSERCVLFPVAYDERFEIFNSPSGEPVVVMGSLNHLTKAAKLVLAKEIERKLNK